jgi:hypothetical protein
LKYSLLLVAVAVVLVVPQVVAQVAIAQMLLSLHLHQVLP